MTLSHDEILENAREQSLKIGEITHADNDYPTQLGDDCIIGFDSYEQAEEFAEKNGCDIHLFKTRDGWHFWHDCGRKHEPLTSDDYIADLGNNYHEGSKDDLDVDLLIEQLERVDRYSDVEEIINNFKEIRKELDNNPDDCVIIGYGRHYETIKREIMSYHEDVWTYEVGVFFPYETNNNEDYE